MVDVRVRTTIALLTLLSLLGCANLPKQSPEFDQASKEMTKLAVMPPKFDMQKVGTFSGDLVSEMNHDIEMVVKEAADTVIEASALSAAALDVSDEALADHPELRSAIFEQQGSVEKVHKALVGTGKSIDIKYEGNGFFKTGGAQVKDAVLAGLFGGSAGPETTTFLSAFIVDVSREKVIWYNEVNRQNSDPRKPTHLLDSVKKLLAPLVGQSAVKWDHSRDEQLIQKYKQRMHDAEAASGTTK
jgi:hypothetical protein